MPTYTSANPKTPLLPVHSPTIAQTSFTNAAFDAYPEGGTGYVNPVMDGTNPDATSIPMSVEDALYLSEEEESEIDMDTEDFNYHQLDGNCPDPFPAYVPKQPKRNNRRRHPGEQFNVMLIQLPDETCMLRCMTGTVIITLAVIVFIVVVYCMRIRENTGLPLEVDDFAQPNPANDIIAMAPGL
uniref:LITAF domain-containing protein n=1 Tax=Panagrellus redivivus TaxID=6233 RepID=A0A7E4VZ92_PANRE